MAGGANVVLLLESMMLFLKNTTSKHIPQYAFVGRVVTMIVMIILWMVVIALGRTLENDDSITFVSI